jgi:formiminotetrahydrofolate cyclodeaminase
VLTNKSVRDLLEAFSSSEPTPGGGSASALAGSVGAALLVMVASLANTRTGSDGERQTLAAARERLIALRDELTDLIDRDSAAYDLVVAAYRLPKSSDEDKAARRKAIQDALAEAIASPLAMVKACGAALEQAVVVARHGNRSASSDVGVALAVLAAAAHGAALNIEINLGGLSDAGKAAEMRQASGQLTKTVAALAQECERLLRE